MALYDENGLFHLWLPKDTPAIKGLLVFPCHGTGEQWSVSPEVQDLAKELSCGIVAFDQLGKLADGTQLGFPGNQKSPDMRPPRLSASTNPNPGVAMFRYSGVQVAGTGFGSSAARL